jgi:hypothetical protein
MPPKKSAELATIEAENVELKSKVAALEQELATEKASKATLVAELQEIKTTLETVANGHMTSERRFTDIEKQLTAVAALQRQPEQRAAAAAANPYLAATRAAPARQPAHGHQPAPPHARQPRRQEPHADVAKFAVYAALDTSCDEVANTVIKELGINTAAIHHVEKIMPRTASQPAAADPSTSAQAAPARTPNAVFLVTTSQYVADKAVKGDLRQKLRDNNIPMFIDDWLNREEQEERKKRVEEKKQLKADGVKAAWRRAELWKLVTMADKSVWQLVPAPAAMGAAAVGAAGSAPATT